MEKTQPLYRPTDDEEFMNPRHVAYFRAKLLQWKKEILAEMQVTLTTLQGEENRHPDFTDRASAEADRALELRSRDRQRKLLSKIDSALKRLDNGTYGYCEETGEPIGVQRLDARPVATLSLQAQERRERDEKLFREEV